MGKFEKKVPFWKRMTKVLSDFFVWLMGVIFLELLGTGVLALLGITNALETENPYLSMLVGGVVILIILGILSAGIKAFHKKKNKMK